MHKNGAITTILGMLPSCLTSLQSSTLPGKLQATEEPYHFKPKSIADENQASSDNSDASERLNQQLKLVQIQYIVKVQISSYLVFHITIIVCCYFVQKKEAFNQLVVNKVKLVGSIFSHNCHKTSSFVINNCFLKLLDIMLLLPCMQKLYYRPQSL